jgi:hypothetical protein
MKPMKGMMKVGGELCDLKEMMEEVLRHRRREKGSGKAFGMCDSCLVKSKAE